jgi:hypothetical protein
MDPQIRARWVAALRSGEYAQGRAMLRTDGGELCCLGVLCELAVTDGVIPPASVHDGDWYYGDSPTALPVAVRQWARVADSNPRRGGAPDGLTLAELNDGAVGSTGADDREPWTFAQIADAIEGGAS